MAELPVNRLVLVVAAGFLGAAAVTAAPRSAAPRADFGAGTVACPAGWRVERGAALSSSGVTCGPPQGKSQDRWCAVSGETVDAPKTVDQQADELIAARRDQAAKLVSRRALRIAGLPAVRVELALTEERAHEIDTFIVRGDLLVLVSCLCDDGALSRYVGAFDAIARSLRLEPGH